MWSEPGIYLVKVLRVVTPHLTGEAQFQLKTSHLLKKTSLKTAYKPLCMNLLALRLLCHHPLIIVSFHSPADSLKVPATTLTIYSVSSRLPEVDSRSEKRASRPRTLDRRIEGEVAKVLWLIRNENQQLQQAAFVKVILVLLFDSLFTAAVGWQET